jgi:hypothetical protein
MNGQELMVKTVGGVGYKQSAKAGNWGGPNFAETESFFAENMSSSDVVVVHVPSDAVVNSKD